jgi:cytoskeleton protein RodZ
MSDFQPEQVRGGEAAEPRGLGRALKRARLALGHDISDVAATLRIRPEYLEALEEGNHARLPGRVYAIGFVRSYSTYLGLDPAVAIERFKAEAVSLDHAHLLPPTPPPEGRVPGGALLFVSLLAGVLLYGGWWILSADERRLPEIVAAVPDRLLKLVDSAVETSSAALVRLPRPEQAIALAPASAAAAATPAAPAAAPAVQPAPRPLAQPASPAPVAAVLEPRSAEEESDVADNDEGGRPAPEYTQATAPETPDQRVAALAPATTQAMPAAVPTALPQSTPVSPLGEGLGRIILRAREENWVQLRDATNAPVMTRVLKPGDILKVPERSGLTLMTGNAGGLDILVDGETVPSLGAPGQVRRNVALDAEKLKAGTAIGRP